MLRSLFASVSLAGNVYAVIAILGLSAGFKMGQEKFLHPIFHSAILGAILAVLVFPAVSSRWRKSSTLRWTALALVLGFGASLIRTQREIGMGPIELVLFCPSFACAIDVVVRIALSPPPGR